MRGILSSLLAAFFLSSCTVLGSYEPDLNGGLNNTDGVFYAVPKGVIPAVLIMNEQTARFELCLYDPVAQTDPQYTYTLDYQGSALAHDTVTVEKYAGSNVLKRIDVTAEDRTDDFLVTLARSAGAIAALQAGGSDCGDANPKRLASALLDPGSDQVADLEGKIDMLGVRMMEAAKKASASCTPRTSSACREFSRLLRSYSYVKACPGLSVACPVRWRENRRPIEMIWQRPTGEPFIMSYKDRLDPIAKPGHGPAGKDCSGGLCYRPVLPYHVSFNVGGDAEFQGTFELPNDSPLIALDISRAVAVTKTTRIEFSNLGQINSFYVDKQAEAVAIADIPRAVIVAYFESFAAVLKIRADIRTTEKETTQTPKEVVEAKQTATKAQEQAEKGSSLPVVRGDNGVPAIPAAAGAQTPSVPPNGTPGTSGGDPIGGQPG